MSSKMWKKQLRMRAGRNLMPSANHKPASLWKWDEIAVHCCTYIKTSHMLFSQIWLANPQIADIFVKHHDGMIPMFHSPAPRRHDLYLRAQVGHIWFGWPKHGMIEDVYIYIYYVCMYLRKCVYISKYNIYYIIYTHCMGMYGVGSSHPYYSKPTIWKWWALTIPPKYANI